MGRKRRKRSASAGRENEAEGGRHLISRSRSLSGVCESIASFESLALNFLGFEFFGPGLDPDSDSETDLSFPA